MTFRRVRYRRALVSALARPDRGARRPIPIVRSRSSCRVGPAGSYDLLGRLVADQLTKRLGQTVRGREPSRRRHRRRHQVGRRLAARRLHAAGRRLEQHRVQRRPVQEPVVRSAARTSCRSRWSSTSPTRWSARKSLPYATPKEIIAAAQAESRRAQARECRRRHRPARRGRRVPGHHRHQVPRGAVPRIVAGVPRPPGRPRRPVLRFDARGAALHQVGPGQGHRHPDRASAIRRCPTCRP